MTELRPAHLYGSARTPFGRAGGALAGVRPDDLAAVVLRGLVDRFPALPTARIDDVILGNANGAGEENRNVARMATLLAGLGTGVPGTTVNRLCGSSLDAAMMGTRQIEVGDAELVIAGGVESMSRAPYVLPKPEKAYPTTDSTLVSTTLGWRLVNPAMPAEWVLGNGEANELLAERDGVARERQDRFAVQSHRTATRAWERGFYDDLVVPVPGVDLTRDESVRPTTTTEALAGLRTVFRRDGTITAGNSSPMSDGAAAVMLGSVGAAELLGASPIARVAGRGIFANDPRYFGEAPIEAANRALARAGIGWEQIGAVELNEAFAVQSLICIDSWRVDPAVVNAEGGALAIGHPLGASGARVLGTLAARLVRSRERWGVAALCIGVGQAVAVVLERV